MSLIVLGCHVNFNLLRLTGTLCRSLGSEDLSVDLQQLISKEQLMLQDYELNIGYDQMSAEEVIRVKKICSTMELLDVHVLAYIDLIWLHAGDCAKGRQRGHTCV